MTKEEFLALKPGDLIFYEGLSSRMRMFLARWVATDTGLWCTKLYYVEQKRTNVEVNRRDVWKHYSLQTTRERSLI